MKIGIVGAGISGTFMALSLYKEGFKDITLIDDNDKPAKKFLVTGNGRCNLANSEIDGASYNDEKTLDIYHSFPLVDQIAFYDSLGLGVRNLDGLIYPYNLSAKDLREHLLNVLNEENIYFLLGSLLDYAVNDNGIDLTLSSGKVHFDVVVFALGGFSHKREKGNQDALFKNHGYIFKNFKPGLVPIKIKEKVSSLANIRVRCLASLTIDKLFIYEEKGEVNFKKDGLGGICIFDISSMIARHEEFKEAKIKLDLTPEFEPRILYEILKEYWDLNGKTFLLGLFQKPMADYLLLRAKLSDKKTLDLHDIRSLVEIIKNLEFTYDSSYGFLDSQVSIGGVSYDSLNSDLSSKKERGIYFIGELLDADGLCGGHNISFALASAHLVASSIKDLNS
jgi:predicted Rossmann fold flavoprotein